MSRNIVCEEPEAMRAMAAQLKGRRVRLVYCSDPYTRLVPGTEGTVSFVDSLGTTHVDWDNGSRLGLVAGEDSYELLLP